MPEFRVFTLAGVPVTVSGWFIVLAVFLGTTADSAAGAVGVMLAVTVSILIHEMGHALVARRLRLGPSVTLHGWGGLCAHRRAQTPRHEIAVAAAGPALQLAYGLAVWVFGKGSAELQFGRDFAGFFWNTTVWVSIGWSLFNLLPLWPLDGGQILRLTLAHRRHPDGERITHTVGLALAAAAGVACLIGSLAFGLIVVALLGYENWRRLQSPLGQTSAYMASPAPSAGGDLIGADLRPTPSVRRLLIGLFAVWAIFILCIDLLELRWAGFIYGLLQLHPRDAIAEGQLWQPLSFIWLHDLDGIGHIVANGIGLWVLGSILERRWGPRDLWRFFILCGVGSGVVSILAGFALPAVFDAPIVGASGGIMGLLVALGMVMPDRKLMLFLVAPMRLRHIVWCVLGLDTLLWIATPESGVAWQTHMGGALTAWILVTGTWRPSVLRDRLSLLLRRRSGPNLRVVDDDDDGPTLH